MLSSLSPDKTPSGKTPPGKIVLVIAAHPDDEILGVGATVAKHVARGDIVHSLILGEGIASREMEKAEKPRQLRELEESARRANAVLGVTEVYFEQLPDNAFDTLPLLEIIKKVEKHIQRIKPEIIYTHWPHDLNVDHRLTFQAVITACRPFAFGVQSLYAFETPSASECQRDGHVFAPTIYENVDDFLQKKIEALRYYAGEMRPFPHPRSEEGLIALAKVRGFESHTPAAEAFQLIREIRK